VTEEREEEKERERGEREHLLAALESYPVYKVIMERLS
jgi:hypothetical protein